MDILNPQSLQERARHALKRGREPKKVVYTYAGAALAISLFITLADLWLDSQISGTGGLGDMGTRAIFSTAQQAIPLLASFAAMCLELGFLHGMMRVSRGQYADHTDLKMGFQKFGPLLRLSLLQGLVYLALAFVAFQIGYVLFMLTPWSDPLMDLLYPIVMSGSATIDDATLMEAASLMGPMYILFGIAYLALLIPVLFRFRMANYCLLDDPRGRALGALRSSWKMTRRRFGAILKIDLSLWPYHLAVLALTALMYLDLVLPLLGISVPMDAQTFSLLVLGMAAAVEFIIQVTLRGHAEVTYLAAYEQLREKPQDNSVVLGNIFDM